ncbi:MAG: lytic transglycosylase domain-containing protein, partial [Rectinema sp.]|nr:lytic transglycosylase domain-containing protein [Rectinema sp.]
MSVCRMLGVLLLLVMTPLYPARWAEAQEIASDQAAIAAASPSDAVSPEALAARVETDVPQAEPEAPMPDILEEEDLSAIDAISETTAEMSLEERAKACAYDIPMPWGHELFEKYRRYYLSANGRKVLSNVLKKASPFLDYIKIKVEEYGLPAEIAFLPVIESAYSPFAVSRSGATGIWQFMRNSIKGYGLTITEWVDERRDFMKSTDAALKKLMDNYKALQDWPLAIAAYNAGLGAVSRAVNKAGGDKDFWHLYENGLISKQALDYVPKFLAV